MGACCSAPPPPKHSQIPPTILWVIANCGLGMIGCYFSVSSYLASPYPSPLSPPCRCWHRAWHTGGPPTLTMAQPPPRRPPLPCRKVSLDLSEPKHKASPLWDILRRQKTARGEEVKLHSYPQSKGSDHSSGGAHLPQHRLNFEAD